MSLIIDAGHGGKDPGAVGNGIVEKDMVLNISLYQFNRFKELGVPVKLTRSSDVTLDPSTRADIVKRSGMKHCISNHINAGGGDGAETIYSIYASDKLANMILDELEKAGQNKRKAYTRKNSSGGDYYFMHRLTGNVETVIIEYGFLDSKKDDIIQLKNNWKVYAEAVVKAYCAYAGYKYTPPNAPKPTTPIKEEDRGRFSDVPKTHVYYKEIERVFSEGLMNGYGDGRFGANDPVTRGQLAVILTRLLEAKE